MLTNFNIINKEDDGEREENGDMIILPLLNSQRSGRRGGLGNGTCWPNLNCCKVCGQTLESLSDLNYMLVV